jgi:hypothetical protein
MMNERSYDSIDATHRDCPISRDTLRRAIDGKALRPNTREACKRAIEQLTKPG